MKKIFTNLIFVLLIIAILLPMLFLLTVVVGEITTTAMGIKENRNIFVQISCFLAALWFFDLVLLLVTLAMKEIAAHGIWDPSEISENEDALLQEEYDRFINKE